MLRVRSLSVLGAIALVTSGCGAGSQAIRHVGAVSEPLMLAAEATSSGSFRTEIVTTTSFDGSEFETKAESLRQGDRSRLTVDLGVPGSRASMELISEGSGSYFRYVGIPADAGLPEGWIEIDTGTEAAPVIGGQSGSVDAVLRAILEGGGSATDEGVDTIEGESLHHYSAQLDLLANLSEQSTGSDSGDELVDEMVESLADRWVDLYLDEDGRLARVGYDMETQGTTVSVAMRFFDFGTKKKIDVPSDTTVMTLDEFFESVGIGSSGPAEFGEAAGGSAGGALGDG